MLHIAGKWLTCKSDNVLGYFFLQSCICCYGDVVPKVSDHSEMKRFQTFSLGWTFPLGDCSLTEQRPLEPEDISSDTNCRTSTHDFCCRFL